MNESILNFLGRTEVWSIGLLLAGFLVLFWAVRGAPLGQATADEPEGSPPSRYRDRVVALAVVGFLIVIAAAYIAVTEGIPWSVPVFAGGFGLILYVLKRNEPYRHVSETLRRAVQFANAALTCSLLGGILVVLNVVAFRYGGEAIDFTRDQSYSLSSLSESQYKSLEKPLKFTIFLGRSDRASRRLDRVVQLLDLVKAQNPSKITVESINPFTDLGEFENLLKRVPDAAILAEGGIALEYGEGDTATRGVVSTQELFETEGPTVTSGKDSFQSTFHGEDVLTSALIRLREGKVTRVAFSVGHAEPSLEVMERSRAGLGYWRSRLESSGLQAIPVNLTSDDVPADAGILVIVAPQTPFQPPEVERIKSFIIRGGRLLMILGLNERTGLEEILRSHNIILGSGHVFDRAFNLNGPSMVATPPIRIVRHPVVDALVGQQVLLPYPRAIEVLGYPKKPGEKPTPKANPGIDAMPILFTGPDSFSTSSSRYVRPDPARDSMGPQTVGVAAMTLPETAGGASLGKPLLMVFSSPYLADNQFLAAAPANLDLLMNSISWLREKAELQGIAPKTHVSLLFTANPDLRARLHLVPTVIAGLLIAALGVLTYLTRRQ